MRYTGVEGDAGHLVEFVECASQEDGQLLALPLSPFTSEEHGGTEHGGTVVTCVSYFHSVFVVTEDPLISPRSTASNCLTWGLSWGLTTAVG